MRWYYGQFTDGLGPQKIEDFRFDFTVSLSLLKQNISMNDYCEGYKISMVKSYSIRVTTFTFLKV